MSVIMIVLVRAGVFVVGALVVVMMILVLIVVMRVR